MKQAVLVTGAAIRVGREIALYLASKQFDIALHYNSSAADAEKTAADIRKLGVECQIFQADLSKPETLDALIEKAHAAFPRLSCLVNSASVFNRVSYMESDYALMRKEFSINFEAPVMLTQSFAQRVKRGAVVNILDTCITKDNSPYFHYLLSKKALADFTRMGAKELGPAIRVNGVAPGFILPPEGYDPAYGAQLAKKLPLGRLPTPRDVAEAVHLLLATPTMTGQCVFIDSGENLL